MSGFIWGNQHTECILHDILYVCNECTISYIVITLLSSYYIISYFPSIQIFLQVIYEARDENSPGLLRYAAKMKAIGAHVRLVPNSPRIQCSLMAQLQAST